MASYTRTLYVLDRALYAQRFRRVDLKYVSTTGAITVPMSLGAQADAALQAVGRDPNWIEVSRQLAQLRLSGFAYVYIRRDKDDIELVPVYGFNGTLTVPKVTGYFDFVWTVSSNLRQVLGSFNLSDTNWGVLARAATSLDGAPTPTEEASPAGGEESASGLPPGEDAGPVGQQKPAASPPQSQAQKVQKIVAAILRTLVDLHWSTVPITTLTVVSIGGPTAELEQAVGVRGGRLWKRNNLVMAIVAPTQKTVLVDCRDLSVHGVNEANSVNVEQLRKNIPFLNLHA